MNPIDVLKIAAFSDDNVGGNPAGVVIGQHPPAQQMQQLANQIGFSETAFAQPQKNGYRVRYFSPQSEVPFCGHATIALGAALARLNGAGEYSLQLNDASITVEGEIATSSDTMTQEDLYSAALQSPATHSQLAPEALVKETLALFDYSNDDLDTRISPALANAGANHLLIALNSRAALGRMHYDLQQGKQLMDCNNLVTVLFAWVEHDSLFHTRNAFASGGVVEDPATGAASAALAGRLRDINWPHNGHIDIVQGEDMGMRSLISANFSNVNGSSIRVSGSARLMA